jgi:SAM-dependent methyltransferase
MKDLVENRRRLSFSTKLRVLLQALQENGISWTAAMCVYYAGSAVANASFNYAARRRVTRDLPALNSPSMNRIIWDNWNWDAGGEEWTPSAAWKRSVIDTFLLPNVAPTDVVVEIGPGAGRWTEALVHRARALEGIDISAACVEQCAQRFADHCNARFSIGSGRDLCGLADNTADSLWSFDVFVHVNLDDLAAYAREFSRVLRPGGRGVVHHGGVAGMRGGWRSDVTADSARAVLEAAGLTVLSQEASWHEAGIEHQAGLYGDVITTFARPVSASAAPIQLRLISSAGRQA